MSEIVSKWGRFEIELQCGKEYGNPLQEGALTATFVSPSGLEKTVEGFWDGGNVWTVRFSPDEEGVWKYGASLASGEQREGSFDCGAPVGETVFQRHGPVRVSESREYLEHVDGTPFFWLVDTAWNGPLLAGDTDWDWYLQERSRQRFTGVQWVATQWRAAPEGDVEQQVAYEGVEEIVVNPAFFQRLDRRVEAMERAGLLSVPVLLWANPGRVYRDTNPGLVLPEDQAALLARYMVARWGAFPVVWILPGDSNYGGEHAAKWQRIGRAVFGDKAHAPVALHCCGTHFPADEFRAEEWCDIIGYQSGHGDTDDVIEWVVQGPPALDWAKEPRLLQLNMEPAYEGHLSYRRKEPHTPHSLRRAIYPSLLNAPTAGTSYGGNGVWGWDDGTTHPMDHPNAGVPLPWNEAVLMPGAEQMGHLQALFASIEWWRLRPAPEILAVQPGDEDLTRYISAGCADERDLAVVYLPFGGELVLKDADTIGFIAGLQSRFFDPRTGVWQPGTMREDNEGQDRLVRIAAPSAGEDWVWVMAPS